MSVLESIGRFVVTLLLAGVFGLVVRTFAQRFVGVQESSIALSTQRVGAMVGGAFNRPSLDPAGESTTGGRVQEIEEIDYGTKDLVADIVGIIAAVFGFFYMIGGRTSAFLNSPEASKFASTLWAVILAVTVSAMLFVGTNILFNQSSKNYTLFKTMVGAVLGFVTFGLLDGNRLIQWVQGRESVADGLHGIVNNGSFTLLIFSVLIGAAIFALYGYSYGTPRDEPRRFATIAAIVGGILGALWGLFFAERIPVDTAVTIVWTPILGAALVGALGYALSKLEQPIRLAVGAVAGAGIGALLGGFLFQAVTPRMEVPKFLIATAVVAAAGAGLNYMRGKDPLTGAISGGLIGWIIGAFVLTGVGGPRSEAIGACVVAGALAGARFGAGRLPTQTQRTSMEDRARGPIFLAPAVFFLSVGLVIPLIRTFYLSFTDTVRREGVRGRFTEFVGLDNYDRIFSNPGSFDVGDWTNLETGTIPGLFTSAPFALGFAMMLIAVGMAFMSGERSGNSSKGSRFLIPGFGAAAILAALFQFRLINADGPESAQGDIIDAASTPVWRYAYLLFFLVAGAVLLYATFANVTFSGRGGGSGLMSAANGGKPFNLDLSGGHGGIFAFGIFLAITAFFASFRGTIFNSLWWVFTVTIVSTVLGLGIAALADRASLENVAKSIIFMPLAISFVGAAIIWRFMFIARPDGRPQTGVLNYLWLKIGDLAMSDWRWVGALVIFIFAAGFLTIAYAGYTRASSGMIGGGLAASLPFLWLAWRMLDGRLGGVGANAGDRTLFFFSVDLPYNQLWLMLILIWIQTGFAMVIFSAAIKAVPGEFIEAAKVDGATDSNIFWRIIVPQILPTIGVVTTTLIVTVLKVFDIVRVMTNGNFETQVIANEMFVQAFSNREVGLGSALAIVLFISVVPVVFVNVRRLQHEG